MSAAMADQPSTSRSPYKRGPVMERFMRYVEKTDGCWNWTGYRRIGYGRFTVSASRRAAQAHRVAYELFVGPIPEGLTIDHLCRNRACVNPAHLEVVTQGENVLRSPFSSSGRNVRKTTCPRGHAYDFVRANGWRRCSTCEADQRQRRRSERKAA